MTAIIIFLVIAAFFALAVGSGADSRFDRPGRQF
jgi:Na+/H+ antiporter NhaC